MGGFYSRTWVSFRLLSFFSSGPPKVSQQPIQWGGKKPAKVFCSNFMSFYPFELIFIGWIGDIWEFFLVLTNFPQTEYFHKKVNFYFVTKCYFWGCDVENWVWTKLALWMCPILWIRVKIGYTQLSLTFFYYYRPIWPIYHTSKKIIFSKKSMIFWSKICSREAKSGSMGIAR